MDLGLTLFDIPKNAVSVEILVFSNIFGFLAVNWASKWTKTVNFGCIPFEPKFKTLKDFSNTVCLIRDFIWSKLQQDQTIFGGIRAQKATKRGHFMDAESIQKILKIFELTTTYAILMKLTTDIYLNKFFHLAESWCNSYGVESANKKTLKMSHKISFLAQF